MKKIRIISPAKAIELEHLNYAKSFLEENGFMVEFGKNAGGQFNYFSGTDEERLNDLQEAINDESVSIILCARGGYGVVRIIDQVDFSPLLGTNRIIAGYSDITVLHEHLFANYKHVGLHSSAPLNFKENTREALDSLITAFSEGQLNYRFESHPLNINGEAKGQVIGGNLSIIYSLIGTNSDYDFSDKILFVEEIGEAVYSIDRMFYSLKKSGKLDVLKAVIIGGISNIKDSAIPFGKSVEEVIYEHVKDLGIPLCFNFPAGHIDNNHALFIGKSADIQIHDSYSEFAQ